ncbi:MAG: hypothetical protein ACLU4N_16070 [Butyricimonas faecihominis]
MVVQQVVKIEYSLLQWVNREGREMFSWKLNFYRERLATVPFYPGTGQLTEKAVRSEAEFLTRQR